MFCKIEAVDNSVLKINCSCVFLRRYEGIAAVSDIDLPHEEMDYSLPELY